jgi:flavin reductase (DIM6/NTAB) family NADH-FMN oxidoreductase RutF
MELDQHTYRNTIGLFATGVTVVSAEAGGEIRGMTANSVTSVSLDPLLLLVCVERTAHMAAALAEADRFGVSILSDEQESASRHFAGQPGPAFTPTFVPIGSVHRLEGSMAALACVTERVLDGGDHLIVLARVEAAWRADAPGAPLLYFAGQYRSIAS